MRGRIILLLFLSTFFVNANQPSGDNYEIFIKGGKKGLLNAAGKVVIPPKYEDLGWSNGTDDTPVDNVIGYKQNSHWGLISLTNKKITSPQFSFVNKTNSQLIIAAKNGRLSQSYFYGALNFKGESVLPFKYSSIQIEGEYLIVSERKGGEEKYGLVNSKFEFELPIEYSQIETISDHILSLRMTNGLHRLYNSYNRIILIDNINRVEIWDNDLFKVNIGLKSGLIDKEGKIIVPIQYKAFRLNEGKYEVLKNSKWEVFSANNELVKSLTGDNLKFYEDKIMIFSEGQSQLLNNSFEQLIPQGFNSIQSVIGDKVLYKATGKYGLFDIKMQKSIMKNHDSLRLEGEFIYAVKTKSNRPLWSLYDTFGIKRTKFDYQEIRDYDNRLFAIKRRNHWGFLDRNGIEVIHCVYDSVGHFVNDKVVVSFHGEQGVIDANSKWVVVPRKAKIELLEEDLFLSRTTDKTTLENIKEELIYFTENQLEYRNGLLWEYRPDSTTVILNMSGTINDGALGERQLVESSKYLNDDWIAVKIKGSYGFIEASTKQLRISNRYQDVGNARGEFISVKIMGKWGAIDKAEKLVVQPNYEEQLNFIGGVAIIKHNGLYGIINQRGEEVIVPSFDAIDLLSSGRYITSNKDQFGLVDADGRILINNKYNSLQDLNNGFVIIQKGDKFGVTTTNGVNTIPQIYDKIIYNPQSDSYFALTKQKWELLINEE